ncbi:hypothetical protein [Actinomadura rugatobispora]|uniref:Rubrerythrin-like domain-containing protein n=1 Tax=Actinomadura rugatobispora TaxID=1994 RepID=A0ABW0ZYF6_9ACTN|nr:hypothetical protein GCM10010200_048890 [Actinomadura rugatobispora]
MDDHIPDDPQREDSPPVVVCVRRWACGTCGGRGIASEGETCPDCNGFGNC